jgi:hypothetical protein
VVVRSKVWWSVGRTPAGPTKGAADATAAAF